MIEVEEPRKIQTIEAYENDNMIQYLFESLILLSRHNSLNFGIANILEFRERMYPNLFPLSIDASRLDNTLSTKTKLYVEAVINRTFK